MLPLYFVPLLVNPSTPLGLNCYTEFSLPPSHVGLAHRTSTRAWGLVISGFPISRTIHYQMRGIKRTLQSQLSWVFILNSCPPTRRKIDIHSNGGCTRILSVELQPFWVRGELMTLWNAVDIFVVKCNAEVFPSKKVINIIQMEFF